MRATLTTTAYVGEVEVDVDVGELLGEISTEDLLEELQGRGEDVPLDGLGLAYQCLLRGDANGALAILEPILHPRFPSTKIAEAAYRKAMAASKGSNT
jgi:hypothetical protein